MRDLRLLAAGLIALCIPMAAYADQVTFTNDGGTFNSNTSQTMLSLSGSMLVGIEGLSGLGIPNQAVTFPCSPCLGSVSLTTGQMNPGGSLNGPINPSVPLATFAQAGSSFTVDGPGGMVFTGTFSSSSWTKVSPGTFQFTGVIMNGTLTIGGVTYDITNAVSIQLTTTGSGEIQNPDGSVSFLNNQGTTNFPSPVPEPGTLTLLGTGLIGIGILVRRRAVQHAANNRSQPATSDVAA